ncbi:MAG: class I SAM-dependent RNA methyltransferase [Candidatus Riflebacteria bacterium]|nr:class I SAM-dependent RNA methyltransferase [Candidatus Riflebacteria bacterium]
MTKLKNETETEKVTGTVDEMDVIGRGLVIVDGRSFAHAGVFPGDRVELEPGERGDKFWQVVRICKPSPDRLKSDCPFHGACGGCDLIELSEKARIRFKEQVVRKAIESFSEEATCRILPFISAPQVIRYRHRMRLHQGRRAGKTDAGFLPSKLAEADETSDSGIVPITACALLMKPLAKRLVAARRALAALPIKVRCLHLACSVEGDEKVAGHVVLPPGTSARRGKPLLENLMKAADLSGISMGPDDGSVEGVIGSVILTGAVAPGVDGGPYSFEPAIFTQGNVAQNRRLIEAVMKLGMVEPGERVVEGFAGAGNFTLAFAAAGVCVEAFESSPGAVRMGNKNLHRGKFTELASIVEGDAHTLMFRAAPHPALLLVDPPRSGMHDIGNLAKKLQPRRVVLVSCDAESLTRDGKRLAAAGYKAIEGVGIDLYPRTHHVEAVVAFAKA